MSPCVRATRQDAACPELIPRAVAVLTHCRYCLQQHRRASGRGPVSPSISGMVCVWREERYPHAARVTDRQGLIRATSLLYSHSARPNARLRTHPTLDRARRAAHGLAAAGRPSEPCEDLLAGLVIASVVPIEASEKKSRSETSCGTGEWPRHTNVCCGRCGSAYAAGAKGQPTGSMRHRGGSRRSSGGRRADGRARRAR